MGRLVSLSLAFVVLLVVACGDGDTDDIADLPAPTPPTAGTEVTSAPPTVDDGVYVDTEHGFRLEYPEDWTVDVGGFGSIVIFLSQEVDADDQFFENVNVITEELPFDLTLDEYLDISLEVLANAIPEFALVSQEPGSLGGQPAEVLSYTGTSEGFALEWKQWLAIVDDVAWIVTYTGERDFADFLPDAEAIVASWQFLD